MPEAIDAIGLIHAAHRPVGDVNGVVFIAGVERVFRSRMIFETQPYQLFELAYFDVEYGQRVVLLKRNPSGFRIRRHGDEFGFEILCDAGARTEDADVRIEPSRIERGETHSHGVILCDICNAALEIDDAD